MALIVPAQRCRFLCNKTKIDERYFIDYTPLFAFPFAPDKHINQLNVETTVGMGVTYRQGTYFL